METPHKQLRPDPNNFIGALKTSPRSTATKQAPNQEKASSKMVGNFVEFLLVLTSLPSSVVQKRSSQFLILILRPEKAERKLFAMF